jgi:hypothetical protein
MLRAQPVNHTQRWLFPKQIGRRVAPAAVCGGGALDQVARRLSAEDLPVLRSATRS